MNDLTVHNGTDIQESQVQVQANRAMSEVQGQIVMAKKFPRDEFKALEQIKRSCSRMKLAEKARYQYPRGGQTVTGPSIRLAEVIAQSWGNLDFGIRELEQKNGESTVEAYCWDLQTNTRQTKIFTVKHERGTKQGIKKLDDPRDVYELVANQGSRRVRACILGIIPSDIVEEALDACKKTLAGSNEVPFQDRIRKMVDAFSKLTISSEMLEEKAKKKLKDFTIDDLVEMLDIFNSIKDGMSKPRDWFSSIKETTPINKELNETVFGKEEPKEKEENPFAGMKGFEDKK